MTTEKPSLDLLRSITDEQVLRLLMEEGRLTRAEIAVRTGISKTTISESMRRLAQVGLVVDTGERTSGRGRAGSYYTLADGCGVAVVTAITPTGAVAEALDALGGVLARSEMSYDRSAGKARASKALRTVVARVRDDVSGAVQACVVSAADPVDRNTGRLVQMPDSPFLVGELDPIAILDDLIEGQVLVDNDVNWAARAERASGAAAHVDDFVYMHLGEGLGAAVVSDGQVRRGSLGVSGEIAHVVTSGPNGTAVPFTEVFAELGLRQGASTAVDVDAVQALLDAAQSGHAPTAVRAIDTLADAVAGVLLAAIAFTDPQLIIIGGPWGRLPGFLDTLVARAQHWPRPIHITTSALAEHPDMLGARAAAVESLRAAIVATTR